MDKACLMVLFEIMAASEQTGKNKSLPLAIDLVLCLIFFCIIARLVSSHVQSQDPRMIFLWTGLTASCMTVVFWLATQMFRAVLKAQRDGASGK